MRVTVNPSLRCMPVGTGWAELLELRLPWMSLGRGLGLTAHRQPQEPGVWCGLWLEENANQSGSLHRKQHCMWDEGCIATFIAAISTSAQGIALHQCWWAFLWEERWGSVTAIFSACSGGVQLLVLVFWAEEGLKHEPLPRGPATSQARLSF